MYESGNGSHNSSQSVDCCGLKQNRSQNTRKKSSPPPLLEILKAKGEVVAKNLNRFINNHESGCHIWTGPVSPSKRYEHYGVFSVNYKGITYKFRAHRTAYAVHYGVDPGEFFVCHKCDTPLCINPEHLELGTHQQNMDDMANRGRRAVQTGSANHNSSLTERDVDFIVSLLPRLNNKQIERRMNGKVGHSAISRIRTGKAWGKYTGIVKQAS